MSDEVKKEILEEQVNENIQVQSPEIRKDEKKEIKKDEVKEDLAKSLDSESHEALENIKEFYDKEFTKLKKELAGVNRSNSELQKKVKDYEIAQLTESEKLELDKRTIAEEYNRIWVLKAISSYGWANEEELSFSDYLNGDSEDEVMKKAELLKLWLDNKIKVGIKKGVDEQIAKGGYIPKSGITASGKKDFETMTGDELGKAYKEAVSQEEKDAIWREQLRRQGINK